MNFTRLSRLLLIAITVVSISVCDKPATKKTTDSKEWAVKINDQEISMKQFNKFYYTQNKLALNLENDEEVDKLAADPSALRPELRQTIIRKNFLDHLIAQRLLYNKAMTDKSVDREELDAIIELSKLQIVGQYYLTKALKEKINVTQKEIDDFHKANKSRFSRVPINEADMQIKRYLFVQKFKQQSNEYILSLIAESKVNKEGFNKSQKPVVKDKPEEKKPEK